ncbi:MAG: outer membrane lipoprotein carrier protein LolA [Bacteroidia bacterium]|nr:outer membrane lipoprotein carrier protein LolA [Bacteroidia bacterium]
MAIQFAYSQRDPRAEKILKSAKNKVNSLTDFSANLKFTLENRATKEKPSIKNGKLKVKADKYRIEFPDQQLICDGKTVWTYLVKEKECNISAFNPNENLSIQRIFKLYESGMKTKYIKQEAVNGIMTDLVHLFPEGNENYIRVELWIDPKNEMVNQAKLVNKNGSVFTYQLSGIQLNGNLQDTEFTFNQAQYPDVEIIDLR